MTPSNFREFHNRLFSQLNCCPAHQIGAGWNWHEYEIDSFSVIIYPFSNVYEARTTVPDIY